MSENAIEAKGLTKKFGRKVVLEGLDLAVPKGENFVIMGLSGTGKSVTLKILAGLLRPDAGTARMNGIDVTTAPHEEISDVRSRLGFLFQGAALIKWMSCLENVALPLLEAGVAKKEARERALARLDEVGLAESKDQMPDELSGGQKKRVGFARATIHRPEIILYDEPTTGLDPITKRTIDELIVEGRDKLGATGVIVSHDLRSAVRVADHMGLLYEGKMVVTGRPSEFLRSDHQIVKKFVEDGSPIRGKESSS